MNKRRIVAVVLLLAVSTALYAYQENYNAASPEFRAFRSLRRLTATQTPEPTAPISGSQLLTLVESLDVSHLNEKGRALYDKLVASLSSDLPYTRNVAQAALHLASGADFTYRDGSEQTLLNSDVLGLWRDSVPMLEIDSTVRIGENFAGRFDFTRIAQQTPEWRDGRFSYSAINTLEKEDLFTPMLAYASVGNGILSLSAGRDRISAGNGRTGNVSLGDNFAFENYLKFSAISGVFSYDLTALTFDPENATYTDVSSPSQNVILHRFSAALHRYVSVSVFEGLLEYGKSPLADLRFLSPFMILHNTFSFYAKSTNNITGFEFSFALPLHLELNLQLLADQIQTGGEIQGYGGYETTPPDAFAALANLTGSYALSPSLILDFYAESALTSHVCYLKESLPGFPYADVDLVVGNCISYAKDTQCLGYKYGPDTFVASTGLSLFSQAFSLDAEATYKISGSVNIFSEAVRPSALPEEERHEYFYGLMPWSAGGKENEKRLILKLAAKADLPFGVSLTATALYQNAVNYNNEGGRTFEDFRLTGGILVDLVDLAHFFVL